MKALFSLKFDGLTCYVFPHGIVSMGGWTFQIEAAGPELRNAIEAARIPNT